MEVMIGSEEAILCTAEEIVKKDLNKVTKWLEHAKTCENCSKKTELIEIYKGAKDRLTAVAASMSAYFDYNEMVNPKIKDMEKSKGEN